MIDRTAGGSELVLTNMIATTDDLAIGKAVVAVREHPDYRVLRRIDETTLRVHPAGPGATRIGVVVDIGMVPQRSSGRSRRASGTGASWGSGRRRG